jgi:hypothetical protein
MIENYSKITEQDITIAEEFFENEKHLDEFLANVSRYYSKKTLTIKTKIVKKYFEAYRKTMDFVIQARYKGKEGGTKSADLHGSYKTNPPSTPTRGVKDTLEATLQPNINSKVISNILIDSDFEKFWELYNKKADKKECLAKFKKLSKKDIEQIFIHVPKYVLSTPDVQFRKNPKTYLNNRSWENEILSVNLITIERATETSEERREREIKEREKAWNDRHP